MLPVPLAQARRRGYLIDYKLELVMMLQLPV